MNNQRGIINTTIIITILAIAILLVGVAWYFYANNDESINTNTAPLANVTFSNINTNTALNINTTVGTNEATDIINTNLEPATNINATTNVNSAVDNTSGWLTYTNDWYNYQMMYPPDWTIEEVDISAEDSVGGWQNRYIKFISPGGEYITYFGVRITGEEVGAFWRSGIGAGDITDEGSTMLGDTSIPITYITYDGIIQDIFYLSTGLSPNIINGHDIYAAFDDPDDVAGLDGVSEFDTSKTILSTFEWIVIDEVEVSSIYENTDCGYNINLPTGWYAHDMTSSIFFLKTATLPSIGATEVYALGHQFFIRCGDITEDAGATTAEEFLNAMIEDVDVYDVPIIQQNVVRNGLNMTRFTMSAAGADGTTLNYYYFNGNTYFDFSHWPYDEGSSDSIDFEAVVNSFSTI
ncbi:MAG: hypothetical protein ACNFW9_05805 [Candidatus Kerfeldbacteria bacterium]